MKRLTITGPDGLRKIYVEDVLAFDTGYAEYTDETWRTFITETGYLETLQNIYTEKLGYFCTVVEAPYIRKPQRQLTPAAKAFSGLLDGVASFFDF